MPENYIHPFLLFCILGLCLVGLSEGIYIIFPALGWCSVLISILGTLSLYYLPSRIISHFYRSSIPEQRRFWNQIDSIRMEFGLFFVLVSLVIYETYRLFTGSLIISSDILALYISFYLTGIAFLIDGIWSQNKDFLSLNTQNKEILKALNNISKKQEEFAKRQDEIDRKIRERNFCLRSYIRR